MLLLQQVSDWPEVHAGRRNGFLLSGVQEKDDVLMGRKTGNQVLPYFKVLFMSTVLGDFLTKSKVLNGRIQRFLYY